MSATAIHKFITFVGFMFILHAAYSAAQREYLHIILLFYQFITFLG